MPPLDVAGNPLCLVSVHADPDDEASKGAGTVARYAAEGIRAALVCCTGGEEGEILNPAADTPEVRADLPAVREAELRASVEAIGYARLFLLGYRDSGMPGTEANGRPDNFANAPLDEAVGRLVAVIRRERPQVLVTYGDERAFYEHPDHLRVHEISGPAFEAAGDPERYPEAGDPWQPVKLYYSGFSFRRIRALHEAYEQLGEESPYAERMARWPTDVEITPPTTVVDVGDFLAVRRAALLAHRTQIDPESHWMRVPDDLLRTTFPWEEYVLARSLVATGTEPETDLFAGVRAPIDVAQEAEVRGVSEFLDDEWIASWVGRGSRPGPTAIVQVVVTGSDLDHDGKWHLRLDDGVVAAAAPGSIAAPDLTLTVPYADGVAMAAGELDPSVAFMQGRMKTAGDPGLVLDLLAGAAQAR